MPNMPPVYGLNKILRNNIQVKLICNWVPGSNRGDLYRAIILFITVVVQLFVNSIVF